MRTKETVVHSPGGVSAFQTASLLATVISVTAAQFKMFEHADPKTMTIALGTAALSGLVLRGVFVGISKYRSEKFSRRLLLLFSLMLMSVVFVRLADQVNPLTAQDTRLITSSIYIGCLLGDLVIYNWVTIKNILLGSGNDYTDSTL